MACGTGVLPWEGVTTELLEELFFIRMEECGEAPRGKDMLA